MQAITVKQELTESIELHPDNVHPYGEVVHVYNTANGQTKYYSCIDCPQRGKILWELKDYTLDLSISPKKILKSNH